MPGNPDPGLEFANSLAAAELEHGLAKKAIRRAGETFGYGRIMGLARDLWRESLEDKGFPAGGEFAVGPCVVLTVPCGCGRSHECEWCCGCGWLTKHVKEIKDQNS